MAITKIDEKTGNAILVCACGSATDKGCPPIPGQDDSTFRCQECHDNDNKAAMAASIKPETIEGT